MMLTLPNFDEYVEYDSNGVPHKKKKRVLPDGATMHVPMKFYDGRFVDRFADGSPDFTSPHKPGFHFADTDDKARLAAQETYEARSRRMEDAWRTKGDARAEDGRGSQQPTLDELDRAATTAYAERSKRMSQAWRQR
jgi:hypothetical protein